MKHKLMRLTCVFSEDGGLAAVQVERSLFTDDSTKVTDLAPEHVAVSCVVSALGVIDTKALQTAIDAYLESVTN